MDDNWAGGTPIYGNPNMSYFYAFYIEFQTSPDFTRQNRRRLFSRPFLLSHGALTDMTVPPGAALGLGLEQFGKGDMDGHCTSLYHIDPYCSHELWNWID